MLSRSLYFIAMKEVPLSNGMVALVDDEDFDLVSRYRWYGARGRFGDVWYAKTSVGGGKKAFMHQLILPRRAGCQTDHRNGNGLDNRRENLRYATHAQNQANQHARRGRSKHVGVCWDKRCRKWMAYLRGAGGRFQNVGYLDSEEAAARARDEAAVALRGEYAALNFPQTEGA